jgi:hypothetical protein
VMYYTGGYGVTVFCPSPSTLNTTFQKLDLFLSSGGEASAQLGLLEIANVHPWTTRVSQLYLCVDLESGFVSGR